MAVCVWVNVNHSPQRTDPFCDGAIQWLGRGGGRVIPVVRGVLGVRVTQTRGLQG